MSVLKCYLNLIFGVHSSYRRFRVDKFYQSHAKEWDKDCICIDAGGKREKKKGQFIIEDHIAEPIYVNIDPAVAPDYVCDIRKMPFEDNYADMIICSEVLEHVDGVDEGGG